MSGRHTATERAHQGKGNSTEAIYTRICALFWEQHHFSEDTPDRVLLQELSLRQGAIEAVRRSNKPHHYPDNGGIDMDLMNLPYEMDVYDSKQLIADVLYSIVRDLPGGSKNAPGHGVQHCHVPSPETRTAPPAGPTLLHLELPDTNERGGDSGDQAPAPHLMPESHHLLCTRDSLI